MEEGCGVSNRTGDRRMEKYVSLKALQQRLKDKRALKRIFLLESFKVMLFNIKLICVLYF